MQPKLKLTPRKIGVQGPSIKKRGYMKFAESSKQPDFTKDEIAELKRLSVMLPPRAGKEQDPAQLVLNAANYIQQLVATVRARVHNGTLPIGKYSKLFPHKIDYPPSFRRESRKKRRSIEKQR
ncbi:unnamed protein product [Heligmosomoides polygyrus]|uniref:BHLH domain-containing protein n=1 Tax=Heligmosomoides polygyrus TaxID=6339 RepID=A0A183FE76_HELPZ|nr:unnamed protein product [Heligmosomoides polygyrus]